MKMDVTHEHDFTIVSLDGAIALNESGNEFFKQVTLINKNDSLKGVVVDLTNVDYMDSTGIGELVGYLHLLKDKGLSLVLMNPQSTIMSLIQLSNLDKVFPIVATKEAAALFFAKR